LLDWLETLKAARPDLVRTLNHSLASVDPTPGLESWPERFSPPRSPSSISANWAPAIVIPERQVGLVFNGAIYNFLDLRRELEAAGYAFRSRSDTKFWFMASPLGRPQDAPQAPRMFAIGIWDAPNRKLFLFRDRLGVKLCYMRPRQYASPSLPPPVLCMTRVLRRRRPRWRDRVSRVRLHHRRPLDLMPGFTRCGRRPGRMEQR